MDDVRGEEERHRAESQAHAKLAMQPSVAAFWICSRKAGVDRSPPARSESVMVLKQVSDEVDTTMMTYRREAVHRLSYIRSRPPL